MPKAKQSATTTKQAQNLSDEWAKQATVEFPPGTDVTVGVDYLGGDSSYIEVPAGLTSCWAPSDDDLSFKGYYKADPQPDHPWTKKGQILWMTKTELYDARKKLECDRFNASHDANQKGIHKTSDERDEAIGRSREADPGD